MTTYEILLMLDPELAEERQDELIARDARARRDVGGTWQQPRRLGPARLAYAIAQEGGGRVPPGRLRARAETLDEILRVLKIDDVVIRHLATRHIEGSRTSAPRDETPAAAAAAPSGRGRLAPSRPRSTPTRADEFGPSPSRRPCRGRRRVYVLRRKTPSEEE